MCVSFETMTSGSDAVTAEATTIGMRSQPRTVDVDASWMPS